MKKKTEYAAREKYFLKCKGNNLRKLTDLPYDIL